MEKLTEPSIEKTSKSEIHMVIVFRFWRAL